MVDDLHSKDIHINKLWKLTGEWAWRETWVMMQNIVERTFRSLRTLQERRKQEEWAPVSSVRMFMQQLSSESFIFRLISSHGWGWSKDSNCNFVLALSLWMEPTSDYLLQFLTNCTGDRGWGSRGGEAVLTKICKTSTKSRPKRRHGLNTCLLACSLCSNL